MKPIVLVIAADGVGGVETRLSEVWLHLAPRMPQLRMLVRRGTLDQLCLRPDLAGLRKFVDRIQTVDVRDTSFARTWAAFAPVLWSLPPGTIVHHILQAPPLLHRLRGHRVLLSWVGTTFPRLSEKPADWAASNLSVRSAGLVDVLDPQIFDQLGRDRALAPKLRLTAGGTIVNGKAFRPGEKRDLVVFLGRVEKYKNALAFVETLPLLNELLTAAGKKTAFRVYGRPADQGQAVRTSLDSLAYQTIDVSWEETSDPASVLAPAKVFVSLQTPSNYPSKALAEAMAAGCVPVITDSGESRRMADAKLAQFIPEHFTRQQLADAIRAVLTLSDAQFARRSAAIRADAVRRFALAPQADYFAHLYAQLGEC